MQTGFTKGDRGFRINFNNGYTISVQFGYGNYCDNYTRYNLLEDQNINKQLSCNNAEVAIIYDNDLVTQEIRPDIFQETIDDSVAGNITPLQVANIISYISVLSN